MPQAHAKNVLIPLPPELELAGLRDEYDRQKRVWKRRRTTVPGRALVVQNLPFQTATGRKTWNPLQVACAALDRAIANGIDVIRVQTPGGSTLTETMDFAVSDLKETMRKDGCFYPDVMDGTVKLEDEARNVMPHTWNLTDGGIWSPAA